MRIGIGNNYYCDTYGFEDGLKRLKSHGYDGIDYQGFVNTETPLFEKNSYEFEKDLKAQYEQIKQQGLYVYQVHGPWRHPPHDETLSKREERFEKMSRSIAGAAMLGANIFVIHPIMPFSAVDAGYEEQTWEMNLEFMERLCKVGRENGVIVCLENLPMRRFSMATVSKVLDFVKTINDDYFKVCLDTGHCAVYGQSPADAVRMIGREYLKALHIHDNDGNRDYHWSPYSGVVDWEDFAESLYETQYEGVFSLEVKKPSKIPKALSEYEEVSLYHKGRYIADLACRLHLD